MSGTSSSSTAQKQEVEVIMVDFYKKKFPVLNQMHIMDCYLHEKLEADF